MIEKIRGNRKDNSPPPTSAPKLSHKAALVAQQMEGLEEELAAALDRAQHAENRAQVAEQQLVDLKKRLEKLQAERDDARDEIARLDGSFDTIASSLLAIMKSRNKQDVEMYRPPTESKRRVAQAMAKEDEPERSPIPNFLLQQTEPRNEA